MTLDQQIDAVTNSVAVAVLECRKKDANKLSIDLLLLMLKKNKELPVRISRN